MKSETPLFHSFDIAERGELERAGRRIELAAGTVFLRVGAASSGLYVVLAGAVRVARPGFERQTELATLGAGAVFGEMSFLDGSTTSASVTAAEATVVLELSRECLDRVMEQNPALAAKLWRGLAVELKRRLVRTNELVDHYVDLAQVLRDNPGYADLLGVI